MRNEVLLVLLAASLTLFVAPAAAQDAAVDAEAQATVGDNVTIETVEIDDDGWVAVYPESVGGGPNFDGLVGAAEVEDGETEDVVVNATGLDENGFYYAVLHYDESDEDGLNYPDDPVVEVNGTAVQDDFYVAVADDPLLNGARRLDGFTEDDLMGVLLSFAETQQRKRTLQERIDSLRGRVDNLSEDDTGDFQEEIDSLNDQIDDLQDDLQEADDNIADTESTLQQLREAGEGDDAGTGGGNETDGNGTEGNGTEGNGSDGDQPQPLPGFTAVAALVAALAAAALLTRRD